ncbi:hypothetical protein K402DRAFT_100719 [Aulographum hederae CBS 113979]|uniref:Arrestin-like N-terminal domain-containing protein n=1 Tax=Aulographum hederae CBS 113979 TaxID=1176131 RepID=A0A6G1GXV9_9PEZI|nr:hypothetical protein K402DRAFT_100719 [Aulographum hederae CBS 113979]
MCFSYFILLSTPPNLVFHKPQLHTYLDFSTMSLQVIPPLPTQRCPDKNTGTFYPGQLFSRTIHFTTAQDFKISTVKATLSGTIVTEISNSGENYHDIASQRTHKIFADHQLIFQKPTRDTCTLPAGTHHWTFTSQFPTTWRPTQQFYGSQIDDYCENVSQPLPPTFESCKYTGSNTFMCNVAYTFEIQVLQDCRTFRSPIVMEQTYHLPLASIPSSAEPTPTLLTISSPALTIWSRYPDPSYQHLSLRRKVTTIFSPATPYHRTEFTFFSRIPSILRIRQKIPVSIGLANAPDDRPPIYLEDARLVLVAHTSMRSPKHASKSNQHGVANPSPPNSALFTTEISSNSLKTSGAMTADREISELMDIGDLLGFCVPRDVPPSLRSFNFVRSYSVVLKLKVRCGRVVEKVRLELGDVLVLAERPCGEIERMGQMRRRESQETLPAYEP